MRIALLQTTPRVGDIAGNAARIVAAAADAARAGARLAVTPEMSLLGYPAEDLVARDDIVAACRDALVRLAVDLDRHAPGLAVAVGLPTAGPAVRTGDASMRTRRNSLVLLDGGQVVHTYDKQLLPDYGVFDETRHFAAGDGSPATVVVDGVRVGMLVCEDLWADPGPADAQAAAGAELLLVANASPWQAGKPDQRDRLVADVARRTGLPVAYVNQVGGQDELVFDGRSTLAWPDGRRVVAHAWAPDVLVVDLTAPGPARASYVADGLADVWQALVTAVADYAAGCGFAEAVLGLSGGIDSAVTATLAADALGGGNVLGITMPSPHSSSGSVDDSAALADALGMQLLELPIGTHMAGFDATLVPLWDQLGLPPGPDVTDENLQARIRAVLLMAVSNKTGRLLLTTGNKSEAAVGYATLYGDMAGGFAPLKDVPKTLVYRLAVWRNAQTVDPAGRPVAREPIPIATITKPPSAELAPGQRDDDSLPDYDTLDAVLDAFVERDRSVAEIVTDGHDPDVVAAVVAKVVRAEHKRRQAAPGPKVTARAFGRDRRYPIANRWQPAARPHADTTPGGAAGQAPVPA